MKQRFKAAQELLRDDLGGSWVYVPRPSSYPLLGPKYLLLGTIYPQLRVQGRSRFSRNFSNFFGVAAVEVYCLEAYLENQHTQNEASYAKLWFSSVASETLKLRTSQLFENASNRPESTLFGRVRPDVHYITPSTVGKTIARNFPKTPKRLGYCASYFEVQEINRNP